MLHPRAALPALVVVALAGCGEPKPAETPAPPATSPEKGADAEKVTPPTAEAAKVELTAEELELLDADPATLTPAQRRTRAFALRKKIMAQPDSAAAKALEKVRQEIESGEVKPEIPRRDRNFSAPTAAPSGAANDTAPVRDDAPATSSTAAPPPGSR